MVSIGRGGATPTSAHSYKLKVGNVVLLNSDTKAPPMTVAALMGPLKGQVVCQWRDNSGKPHAGTYHEDMLRVVEVKSSS